MPSRMSFIIVSSAYIRRFMSEPVTAQLVAHVRWRWWFWPLIRCMVLFHVEPKQRLLEVLAARGMVVWVDNKATLHA